MMKSVLSLSKTAIVFLALAIVFLGLYTYMLARPISYAMGYHNESAYDGRSFEGTMKFYSDATMVNYNTNFNEEMQSRYYYKDGYVFFTMAQTDEEYEKEVATINENFDEAIKTPFYADEINAFRLVLSESDGPTMVYTCTPAIIFAVVGGVVELLFIALAAVSFVLYKKSKCKNEGC